MLNVLLLITMSLRRCCVFVGYRLRTSVPDIGLFFRVGGWALVAVSLACNIYINYIRNVL